MTPDRLNAIERGALANHCKAVFLSKKMGGTEGKDVREVADDMICTIEHLAKEIRTLRARQSACHVQKAVDLDRICEAVGAYYSVSKDVLKGNSRYARHVHARHVAFWLCKEMTGDKFTYIGHFFGKNHASVLYGCRKIDHMRSADERLRDDIELIQMRITERLEQPKEAAE